MFEEICRTLGLGVLLLCIEGGLGPVCLVGFCSHIE